MVLVTCGVEKCDGESLRMFFGEVRKKFGKCLFLFFLVLVCVVNLLLIQVFSLYLGLTVVFRSILNRHRLP